MPKAKSTQPPADVIDFANRYFRELNSAIRKRMLQVGVPEEMIGFRWPGIDDGPFVRYPGSQLGANINPFVFPGRRPGINLDYGVLDDRHPAMRNVPSWRKSRLRDRVDAVIAHEYSEALAREPRVLWSHEQAVLLAPSCPLAISAQARQMLREYRAALGLA